MSRRPDLPRAASTGRRPGRLAWLALGLALLVGAGVWLRPRHARARASVPDPVRPEMTAPVRLALEAARDAARATPDSAAAWGELAEACDAHHLFPEAELAYREARALDGADFRWVYGLVVLRDFQGAPAEELVPLFAEAIRLQPRYPPVRLRQGDALVRQGRLEEARAAYEAALALDPDFAMAHRNLGQTLLALEDLPGALSHLERAAELTPDDGVIFGSLAQACWRLGDEARAQSAAAEAERKAPVFGVPDPVRFAIEARNVSPLACEQRAREHEARGEWAAALPDLENLAQGSPDEAGVRWRLGRCLRALGRRAEGQAQLERALSLRPEHLGALLERAGLAFEDGDSARATELYRRATSVSPENGLAWKRLGSCLGQSGDLAGALEAFERADANGVADAELLHNWGTALARAGRPGEACERLRAALRLEPDNAGTHYNLADALEALGAREEAIEHFERARELAPGLPAAQRLEALRARR